MGHALIALDEFLLAAFSPRELHRLLTYDDSPVTIEVCRSLPDAAIVSPSIYVFELVQALERHNALDRGFFEALRQARPAFAQRIDQLEERVGGDKGLTRPQRLEILLLNTDLGKVGISWEWEQEARLVVKAVEAAASGTEVHVDVWPRTTARDLPERLQRSRPHMVHFIGHCTDGGVILNDEGGGLIDFPVDRFCSVLGRHRDDLRLVLLNACNSGPLAERLAGEVRHAIGWQGSVLDTVAVAFGGAFYQSLLTGASVADSFGNAHDVAASLPEVTGRRVPTRGIGPSEIRPVLCSADSADAARETLANLW